MPDSADGVQDMPLEVRVGRLLWPVLDERAAERYAPAVRAGRLGGGILRWHMPRGSAAGFIKQLRAWARQAPGRPPFFISVDHEGGPLFTQPELGTMLPGNMALGAAGSAELAELAARASAGELRALDVDINFAPVVDVNSNPDNPIIGVRSFGEDPAAVAALGAAAVRGYLRGGILPAAKHFPGHGDTSTDSHAALPTVAYKRTRWEQIDLPPFRAAIAAGVPMIMTAHVAMPALGTGDLPATLSSAALQGVLREELGYEGVIVSDSLDMGAITKAYGAEEAAISAILAGCDVLLLGKGGHKHIHAALMRAVREGRISEKRLNASVRRILALPARADQSGDPVVMPDRRIAEASITLLRNEDGLVPLRLQKGQRLLALSFEHPMFGPAFDLLVKELRERHADTDSLLLREDVGAALTRAGGADVIIVGTYQWGGGVQARQKELLARLRPLGKSVIQLSLLNPYEMRDYPAARTVLLTYGTAPASLRAAVSLLFGESPFRGHVPVTFDDRRPRR